MSNENSSKTNPTNSPKAPAPHNPGYKTHVFVCTNGGENPQKCASKGSEGLRRSLKDQCAPLFGKSVRINASGCLGYCEHGITSVIYREGQPAEWHLELTADSQNILMDSLKGQGQK